MAFPSSLDAINSVEIIKAFATELYTRNTLGAVSCGEAGAVRGTPPAEDITWLYPARVPGITEGDVAELMAAAEEAAAD